MCLFIDWVLEFGIEGIGEYDLGMNMHYWSFSIISVIIAVLRVEYIMGWLTMACGTLFHLHISNPFI